MRAPILVALVFLAAVPGCHREEPIRVTPEVLSALEDERAELLGRALTEAERAALRDEWIDQEVLVREAYRLGLDKNDGVVRHRLLQKMRLLLAEKQPEPSREELLAYYQAHEERYRSPELVSLDHVLFGKADEGAGRDGGATLRALKQGADFRRMGQRFWLGSTLAGLSQAELGRVLGDAFAEAVLRLPVGEWAGPLPSIRGVHFVRLTERRPPVQRPFEEVLSQVREDLYEAAERETLKRKIADLARRHRIQQVGGAPAR